MTSTTQTQKTDYYLDKVSIDRKLTDIEFLEAVVADLDSGWITGEMCDTNGKCLVGGGAAALGLNYGVVHAVNESEWIENGDYPEGFRDHFYGKIRDKEYDAAHRLIELLGTKLNLHEGWLEDFMSNPLISFPAKQGSVISAVTSFNDSSKGYTEIRQVLVDKIEELRG